MCEDSSMINNDKIKLVICEQALARKLVLSPGSVTRGHGCITHHTSHITHHTATTSHTGFIDRQKQTGIKTDLKEVDREEIMKYTLYIDHELLNYRFKY